MQIGEEKVIIPRIKHPRVQARFLTFPPTKVRGYSCFLLFLFTLMILLCYNLSAVAKMKRVYKFMVTDHRGNKWLEHSVIDPMLYVRVNGGFAVIKEVIILDYWHIKVNSSLYYKNIEEIERWKPKDYAIREVFGEKAVGEELRPAIIERATIERKRPRPSDALNSERRNGKRIKGQRGKRAKGQKGKLARGQRRHYRQSRGRAKIRLASYDKLISSLVEPKRTASKSERLATDSKLKHASNRNTQNIVHQTSAVNTTERIIPASHRLNSTILERVKRYDSLIVKAATVHNLNSNLLRALVYVESSGKKKAISPKKAMGLTQLTYQTAKAMKVRNAFDPEQNLMGGAKYLSLQMKKFRNERDALAAYNAGPDRARSGNLPLETRNYIDRVLYVKNLLRTRNRK